MQIFNYHTHTYRCKHAIGKDEEYILKAIEAGYKVLGFSDHAPYKDYPSDYAHMDIEQLDEYISSINELKEKYKDIITIKLGLESEYYPFNHDERVLLREKVDYFILGQHFSHPSGKIGSYFKTNTDEEIIEYCQNVLKALDTGLFTYLAHPDVFMNGQDEFNETCQKVAHLVSQKCAETSTPMEVNLRGIMRGKKEFINGYQYAYPHKDFWRIASQYPIKCLFGVDAHSPDELSQTDLYELAYEELKDLNLNFINDPFI